MFIFLHCVHLPQCLFVQCLHQQTWQIIFMSNLLGNKCFWMEELDSSWTWGDGLWWDKRSSSVFQNDSSILRLQIRDKSFQTTQISSLNEYYRWIYYCSTSDATRVYTLTSSGPLIVMQPVVKRTVTKTFYLYFIQFWGHTH